LREIQPLKKSDWEKIIVYWEKENNLPPLEESSKIVDFFSFVKEYC
jgi:hypothetical protein